MPPIDTSLPTIRRRTGPASPAGTPQSRSEPGGSAARPADAQSAIAECKSLLDGKRTDALVRFVGDWVSVHPVEGNEKTLARILRYAGDALRFDKRYEEALSFYSRSALFEDASWTQLGIAECMVRLKRLKEARQFLGALLKRDLPFEIFDKTVRLAGRAGMRDEVRATLEELQSRATAMIDVLGKIASAGAMLGEDELVERTSAADALIRAVVTPSREVA